MRPFQWSRPDYSVKPNLLPPTRWMFQANYGVNHPSCVSRVATIAAGGSTA